MLRRLLTETRQRVEMLVFTGSNLSLQATALICQFVVLKWIGPEDMGVWGAAALLNMYLAFLGLGVVNAMNREYPFFLGREEPEKAALAVQTTQTFVVGNAAVLAGIFAVLGLVRGWNSPQWRWAFWLMACFSAACAVQLYLECSYRVAGRFHTLAKLRAAMIPIHVGSLALPYWFGFEGFCIRMAAIPVVAVVLLFLFRPLRERFAFRWETFRLLLSAGWRLHLALYLITSSRQLPRLALLYLGGATVVPALAPHVQGLDGKELLGLFTPVGWMFLALFGIVNSFSMYMHPKLTFHYARNRHAVGRTALRFALKSTLLLTPVAAIGMVVLHFLVPAAAPKYIASLPAMQVSLIASLFDCIGIARIAFIAMKAWRAYFVYIGATVVLFAAGSFGGFWALPDDRLLGVAFGRLAAAVAMAVVTWITVLKAAPQRSPAAAGGGDV